MLATHGGPPRTHQEDQQRKRRNGQLVLHECLSLKDAERYTNFSEFLDI
jgi:hypothetical protein